MSGKKVLTEKQVMKKKLIINIVELIIGLVLLGMCYAYIQTHPAEKISFFSGYKVIYQQTEIFFQNLFGQNGDILRQKYNLESYYHALINLSESKPCVDPSIRADLHSTYEALQDESKNNLEYTLPYYIEKQHEFDEALQEDCHSD